MYIKITRLVIVLSLVLITITCDKEDFTKPSKVSFSFHIMEDEIPDNFLSFTGGEIYLNEFDFEGYRESAQDYFFEKEFDPSFLFSLNPGFNNQPLNFDIPQGIYNRINILLDMEQETEGDSKSALKDDELETAFQISSIYTKNDGGQTHVLFNTEDIEFEITAEDQEGGSVIVLQAEKSGEAKVYFDPAYAFQTLPRDFFESAETEIINNEPTILFSDDSYESLYEMILYRLQISAKVIIF